MAPFKIMTKQENDVVDTRSDRGLTILDIRSPKGISNATIERVADSWPEQMEIHLHLKGLESFSISCGTITLRAAISSNNEGQKIRVWKDNQEEDLLNPKNPLFPDIRMMGGDGKIAKEIPLANGYFLIPIPKALLKENPKKIMLNWIDFYR